MRQLTLEQYNEIRKSNASAQHVFRQLRVRGWPKVEFINGTPHLIPRSK